MTPYAGAFLQLSLWELLMQASLLSKFVLALLLAASILSWTIIFAKWSQFRGAESANRAFLGAFRKAQSLELAAMASQQFRIAPLTGVFDFGHEEVNRQLAARGRLSNAVALERSLQLGTSEELARLERNMSWLATTAAVSPFVGLFGTVLGIIDAFTGLGMAGSASLRAVAPGIAEALVATAAGLGAAIPAAVAYNQFGHRIRELGARMEDFSLEFLNLAERAFGN
jgi:biopolymer transport protein TolQ